MLQTNHDDDDDEHEQVGGSLLLYSSGKCKCKCCLNASSHHITPLGAGQVTHLNQWSGNVVGRGGRSRKSRSLRPAKHYNLGVKVRSIPSSPLHLHLQIGICRLASTCELSHVHVPRRAGIERKSLLASFLNFSSAATSPMVPLPPLHATPVKVR